MADFAELNRVLAARKRQQRGAQEGGTPERPSPIQPPGAMVERVEPSSAMVDRVRPIQPLPDFDPFAGVDATLRRLTEEREGPQARPIGAPEPAPAVVSPFDRPGRGFAPFQALRSTPFLEAVQEREQRRLEPEIARQADAARRQEPIEDLVAQLPEQFREPARRQLADPTLLETAQGAATVYQEAIIEPLAASLTATVHQELRDKYRQNLVDGLSPFEALTQAYQDTELPTGVKGSIELAADLLLPVVGFGGSVARGTGRAVTAAARGTREVAERVAPTVRRTLTEETGALGRQSRFDAGPRAVPLADAGGAGAGRRPPADFPPTPEGGLPSGRVPGGPGRMQPPPPRDPYRQVLEALEPEPDPLGPRLRRTLPQQWYDRNFPLKELQEETGIPARDLAQVVPGAITAGEDIIRRFYHPVIRDVEADLPRLQEYMTLKRMEDILARNPEAQLPGGVQGWSGVIKAQDTLRSKIGPERYAKLEQTASDLWRLNDEQNLQALLREGIISNEQYVAIKSAHPHYIPFTRADFIDAIDKSFARPEASVSSTGIKTMGLEGSERNLDKPLQRLLNEPVKTQSVIYRNRAARSIVEALEEMQTQTRDVLVRKPTGAAEHSKLWETISYYKDGEKVTVEVPAIFGRVAKDLEAEPDNVVLQWVRRFNAPLRQGATEFNPFFLPVNIMRDAMSAMFRENVIPFGPDYFAGLWAAIRKNTLFTEAAQSGALMSGIIENMRPPRGQVTTRLGRLEVKSPKDALLLLPRLISEANITAERGIRLATFRKLRAQGISPLEAAIRTRDVSVDFAKSGHAMRVINQVVPFSNAAVQGSANIARTVRDHPVRSLAYGALFTAPTFITRINNMRFETSEQIPDYEYTRNWVVQVGEGTRKDGTKFPIYIKIPKGEIAGMFTFPAEALFHLARKSEDRSAVELLLEQGRDQALAMSPIDPGLVPPVPFVQTGAGLATNTNLFTGAPIVPEREQDLLPEQQFGPETSETAVAIGQATGISPRLIEFAIEDYLAGAGQSTNWLLSAGLEAAGYEPESFGQAVGESEPEGVEAAAEVPGIRRFVSTRDTQVERRGWEIFNNVTEQTNRQFNDIPEMNRLGIRLGRVPDSIDIQPGEGGEVELTPAQRAKYQAIMAETVIGPVERLAERLAASRLPDEQKRKLLQEAIRDRKDAAREQAIARLVVPILRGSESPRPASTIPSTDRFADLNRVLQGVR